MYRGPLSSVESFSFLYKTSSEHRGSQIVKDVIYYGGNAALAMPVQQVSVTRVIVSG